MNRRLVWSLFAVLAGLSALVADATTLLKKEAAQLVDESEAILVGTVVDLQSVATADASFAFTFVTIKVERLLKGSTGESELTLRLAGGDLGDEVIEVDGVPRFELGRRYLLFVADNGRAAVPLVGWVQGRLEMVRHPLSGEEIVVDHLGRAVAGLSRGAWASSSLAMSPEGFLASSPEPGVTILDAEGVKISAIEPQPLAEPLAASAVLAQLEQLIGRRAGRAGSRPAAAVASVSLLEVPPTVRFRAQQANSQGGVR